MSNDVSTILNELLSDQSRRIGTKPSSKHKVIQGGGLAARNLDLAANMRDS